jgi:hypothetical protein
MGAPRCTGKKTNGEACKGWRVPGSTVCTRHLPNPKARANAAVRAEVSAWSLTDQHADPGEVLLRLVTQSAARVQRYSALLEEAYEAAERLRGSHEAHALLAAVDTSSGSWVDPETGKETFEPAAVQQAKADLDRIFNLGGVAALVGATYSTSNSGSLYETGEAIRGLADLEAKERDRCAGFATKAIAAGLAERQVRLAEKQGQMIADVLRAVLGDPELGLSAEQRAAAPATIRRHLSLAAS